MAKRGTGKGLRKPRVSRPMTPAQEAARKRNLAPGGDNEYTKAAREKKKRIGNKGVINWVQDMNILEFAEAAGISFEGRPGQELVLRLMYGLPLPDGEIDVFLRRPCEGFVLQKRRVTWLEYYTMLTGNLHVWEPRKPKTSGFLCVGARSGKSKGVVSLMALYEGSRNHWLQYLRKGETAYVGIVATNLDQARGVIQEACLDTLENSDLKGLMVDKTQRQIILANGMHIRSFPCNTRAGRGFPYVFTVYDEAGFFYLEGSKADTAVHAAFDPRRLQFPGSKHMEITTPAGKQGRFYDEFMRGAQVHNRVTVKAPTWLFRPEYAETNMEFFVEAFEGNPDEANREYGDEFDETIDKFLTEEEIASALRLPAEAPRQPGIRYFAGIDASGLSGNDRFGFAISGRDHTTGEHIVAVARSWPDKTPDPIMADIEDLCRQFGIYQATTDRYAKGWVHAALRKRGIEPVLAPTDMEVWLNLKQIMAAKRVAMPADTELEAGLKDTNKAYGQTQKPRIVRPRNRRGHGDKAEAVAKAVWASSQNFYSPRPQTEQDRRLAAQRKHEEENYDPLTHGRC